MGRFHFHDSAQKIGCRLSGLTCPDKHFSGHLCPDKLRTFGFGVVRENLRENLQQAPVTILFLATASVRGLMGRFQNDVHICALISEVYLMGRF